MESNRSSRDGAGKPRNSDPGEAGFDMPSPGSNLIRQRPKESVIKPAEKKDFQLRSKAESDFPEAFNPVSKEFWGGLTDKQRDAVVRLQAIANEKVGFEKGTPKFFIEDFGSYDPDQKKSDPLVLQEPIGQAAPRLVVGGALAGCGLYSVLLGLIGVLAQQPAIIGGLAAAGLGLFFVLNPRF